MDLIDTLWNVKKIIAVDFDGTLWDLIDTLWNVKLLRKETHMDLYKI